MHLVRICGLASALLLGTLLPAAAQETCIGANVLGVSRVVEIDTSTGPKFGFQYHDAPSFLAEGEVVLTFDDGPLRAYTKPVLEALAAQCTKATFFVVGRMAVADPEMVKEYARRGHTVGTHTWSHQNLAQLSAAQGAGRDRDGLQRRAERDGQADRAVLPLPLSEPIPARWRRICRTGRSPPSPSTSTARTYRTRDPGTVHRVIMGSWRGRGRASCCSTTSSRPPRVPCRPCSPT